MCFRRIFFVSRFFLFYLPQFVSFEKSDSFDDESDNDGSESRSDGMCAFSLCFDEFVGHVGDFVGRFGESVGCFSCVGSGFFFLAVIESIGDLVTLVVFVPKGVKSKVD